MAIMFFPKGSVWRLLFESDVSENWSVITL